MMPAERNGWSIYYHPLFADEYTKLENKSNQLYKQTLSSPGKAKTAKSLTLSEYKNNSTVKLFAALVKIVEEKIPKDPSSTAFELFGSLGNYSRVKAMGLPERYRLFFKVFKEEKVILICWLGYPRKAGHKKDCYAVFNKLVDQGNFPETVEELIQAPSAPS